PDDLLVAHVRLDRVDADDDGLVHRARDDDAASLLTATTLRLGLRMPAQRLPRRRGLALRARALAALAACDALSLLLRLERRRRSGLGLRLRFGGRLLRRRLVGRGLVDSRLGLHLGGRLG